MFILEFYCRFELLLKPVTSGMVPGVVPATETPGRFEMTLAATYERAVNLPLVPWMLKFISAFDGSFSVESPTPVTLWPGIAEF